MRLPVLFLLAITTPLLLAASLVLPIYASMLGAVYTIYMPASGPHPLDARLLDIFYIADAYRQLFTYWWGNMDGLSFVDYGLPILGMPIFGVALALWLSWKLGRKLLNVFHLSSSIH